MRTGNLLIYSATEDNFCIWPRALPRCRRCRVLRWRKPIRRSRCAASRYAPEGGTDIFVRLVGRALPARLGQPFIIENRPGASSNIATETVVRAPADGYTLSGRLWDFLSVPNCAPEVFVHTRRHVFVVRMRDVFAYRL